MGPLLDIHRFGAPVDGVAVSVERRLSICPSCGCTKWMSLWTTVEGVGVPVEGKGLRR